MNEILNSIFSTFLSLAPFALLYFFFNWVEQQPHTPQKKRIKRILYGLVSIVFIGFIILGLLLQLSTFLIPNNSLSESPFHDLKQDLQIQNVNQLFLLGLSLWMPSMLALIFLIPIVRRGIAHFIPIQATNSIHTITLVLSTSIIIQLGSTLAIGLDSLSTMVADESTWSVIAQLWTQDLMFLLIACLGVGYLTRRNSQETLQRLGLQKMTFQQFWLGCGIAICLVAIAYFLEIVLTPTPLGMEQEAEELTQKLIGPLFTSIPGVFTLGLAAAIGEEAIFRGALQPRFGLFLTSLLFAIVHSNYGLSLSTLIVFGVGICLGIVRIRFNTTVAMLVHALYNICLGLIIYFQS